MSFMKAASDAGRGCTEPRRLHCQDIAGVYPNRAWAKLKRASCCAHEYCGQDL